MRFFQKYSWISWISAIFRQCQKQKAVGHLTQNQRNRVNFHISQSCSFWETPTCCHLHTTHFQMLWLKAWYMEFSTQIFSQGRAAIWGNITTNGCFIFHTILGVLLEGHVKIHWTSFPKAYNKNPLLKKIERKDACWLNNITDTTVFHCPYTQ